MRSFVVALVVAIVVAVGFALVLNIFQEPAASAFSTESSSALGLS